MSETKNLTKKRKLDNFKASWRLIFSARGAKLSKSKHDVAKIILKKGLVGRRCDLEAKKGASFVHQMCRIQCSNFQAGEDGTILAFIMSENREVLQIFGSNQIQVVGSCALGKTQVLAKDQFQGSAVSNVTFWAVYARRDLTVVLSLPLSLPRTLVAIHHSEMYT